MEITPRELRDIEIREQLRGYNRDEVNDLLERAAQTIEGAMERAQSLSERLNAVQGEAGRTRETEDILHRTLLLAQRAADEAVAEATAKARQMLDDAEIQARRLVADSEAEARRRGEAERRRLEEEVLDLASRRDALLSDVEALTRFEAEYRERMVRALEADLFALRSRSTTAPGAPPEPSNIELPKGDDAHEMPSPSYPPSTSASAPPAAGSAASDEPGPASMPESSTREIDVRSLFEQQTAHLDDAPETDEPAPSPPIDLLANDGADADVLDDDAFFATLRDAVHDEAPLGPREEGDDSGEHRFFDQDADRGSFRDVFRRRR